MTKSEVKKLNKIIDNLNYLIEYSIFKSRVEINKAISEAIAELKKMAGD